MSEKKCPNCGSIDLNFKPWLGLVYTCRKCGWQGTVVVEEKKGQEV